MEGMVERDDEAVLGVDLVPRRSKIVNGHHPLPVFDDIAEMESERDGETESRSVGEEEGGEDERIDDGDMSSGSPFGGTETHQGSETPNGLSTAEHQLLSGFLPAQKNSVQIIHDASMEISENDITHLFSTATSEASSEDRIDGVHGYTHGIMSIAETTVLEEPIPELDDVEKVINSQETHDLFCPNCNSCITKRVILRRRKRKIQEMSPSEDNQDIIIPEPIQNPSPPVPEEPIEETKQGAFECLSCFSIFIPIGRGFKLIFGGRESKETSRDAEQGPLLTTSADAPGDVPEDENANISVGVDIGQEQNTVINQPGPFTEQSVEPTFLPSDEIQESMPVPEFMALPAEQKLPMRLDSDVGDTLPDEYDNIPPEKQVEEKQVQVLIHDSKAPALPSTSHPQQEVNGDQVVVSVQKDPDHTVVTMTLTSHTSPESEPLLQPENITEATPAAVPATGGGDGPSDLDVIKCIIYGGLLESIASLSIVTSAAGADAKTLNIVALAAANMFGGLFVLAHNLRVLKHENSNERYEEVLGRPGHFTFHSVVAVLSYIVFGLIPPLVYGFSFRESDNRDYKLIAVASASLVCIVLLSLGKAHTRTLPRAYSKTLMYYVALWVMACGVSYLAGELLDFLLEKLGLFDSTTSAAVGFITPWAAYSVL